MRDCRMWLLWTLVTIAIGGLVYACHLSGSGGTVTNKFIWAAHTEVWRSEFGIHHRQFPTLHTLEIERRGSITRKRFKLTSTKGLYDSVNVGDNIRADRKGRISINGGEWKMHGYTYCQPSENGGISGNVHWRIRYP